MMGTLIRPTNELTDADRRAVIDVCIAAHNSQDFENLFSYFAVGRHVLGYAGSELVSHAVVTTRWAQPDGRPPLRTAFVDAVSTHPAHQHRGHGSATMRALGEAIADYDIGCLQTDLRGFYEPLGWELWRGPLSGRKPDGSLVPTPDQQGVMVLRTPRTPSLDLDTGLSIEVQPARIWE